jgi:hypothetical protein
MSRTLAEGPKVFAFNALTCEALENFDLSVSTADYLQPFPTVTIQLPQNYTKKRIVPFDAGSRGIAAARFHLEPVPNRLGTSIVHPW